MTRRRELRIVGIVVEIMMGFVLRGLEQAINEARWDILARDCPNKEDDSNSKLANRRQKLNAWDFCGYLA